MTATLTRPQLDPDLLGPLRDVLDPELGVNIVELGLVLHASRTAGRIGVRMTLTSRACPLGEMVVGDVRDRLARAFPEVAEVDVQLVWEPSWTPDFITDRGYQALGRPRARTMT